MRLNAALTTLPPRIGFATNERRLPGGTIAPRGAVRALVFPVSLGERLPVWPDSTIAYHVIGSHLAPAATHGAAGRLATASLGLFRLDGSVFPHLVEPSISLNDADALLRDPAGLQQLAARVLHTWGSRANLAAYDNDGPDGQPMSGDDDGALDLVVLAIETDSTPAIVRVPLHATLPVGENGRLRVRTETVYVIALPRTRAFGEQNLGSTALILGALGLDLDEMFFPVGFGRDISTLARLRLGWVAALYVGQSGTTTVPDGQVRVLPIVDVSDTRGLWLVERMASRAVLTRVARRPDGRFAVIETRLLREGADPMLVPLTTSLGAIGPRFRVTWPAGGALRVRSALTPRAIADDSTDAASPAPVSRP